MIGCKSCCAAEVNKDVVVDVSNQAGVGFVTEFPPNDDPNGCEIREMEARAFAHERALLSETCLLPDENEAFAASPAIELVPALEVTTAYVPEPVKHSPLLTALPPTDFAACSNASNSAPFIADANSAAQPVLLGRGVASPNNIALKDDTGSEWTQDTELEVAKPNCVKPVEAYHQLKSQDPQSIQSSNPSFVEVSLLLYSIFYAAVSRVPFTLFAIYMIDVLQFSYLKTASTLGLYCFGRLLGAHLAGTFVGSATMMFGTVSGGIAWSAIIYLDPIIDASIFVWASWLLGFTETVTGLDTMLKIESLILRRHPDYTQKIFRSQLIFTCVGVFLAYMGGGCLYQYRGLQDVGNVCIVFTVIEVVILCFVFWKRGVYRRITIRFQDIQDAIVDEMEAISRKTVDATKQRSAAQSRVSRMSVSGGAEAVNPRQRVSMADVSMLEVEYDNADGTKTKRTSFACDAAWKDDEEEENEQESNDNPMASNIFLGSVVACFFFTTLGISTQFAISALYWNAVWSVGADVVGTIMAIGEGLGVCCLLVFSQPAVFNSPLTKYFGKPVNVLNACLGMGVMMYVLTLNNKAACAIGSVCVHMCNVCVHSFQAELIGICATGENFSKWIARSYVVKRLANCVCVFGSLIFFNLLGPRASYHTFGAGLSLYAALLGSIYLYLGVWPFQLQRKARKGGQPNFTPLQRRLSQPSATSRSSRVSRVSISA